MPWSLAEPINKSRLHSAMLDEGFELERVLSLSSFHHLMKGCNLYEEMTPLEKSISSCYKCVIWKKTSKPRRRPYCDIFNGYGSTSPSEASNQSTHRGIDICLNVFPANLPDELILMVLQYLDLESHFDLAYTCKQALAFYLIGREVSLLPLSSRYNLKVLESFFPGNVFSLSRFGVCPVGAPFDALHMSRPRAETKQINFDAFVKYYASLPCVYGCFFCDCHCSTWFRHEALCMSIGCLRRGIDDDTLHETDLNFDDFPVDISSYHNGGTNSLNTKAYVNLLILKSLFLEHSSFKSRANMDYFSHLFQTVSKTSRNVAREVDKIDENPQTDDNEHRGFLAVSGYPLDQFLSQLFPASLWYSDETKHSLHNVRAQLDNFVIMPMFVMEYSYLSFLYNIHEANHIAMQYCARPYKYGEKDIVEACARKSTREYVIRNIFEQHASWRERWVVLRFGEHIMGKRSHSYCSDRSYGEVDDMSPFITSEW